MFNINYTDNSLWLFSASSIKLKYSILAFIFIAKQKKICKKKAPSYTRTQVENKSEFEIKTTQKCIPFFKIYI